MWKKFACMGHRVEYLPDINDVRSFLEVGCEYVDIGVRYPEVKA